MGNQGIAPLRISALETKDGCIPVVLVNGTPYKVNATEITLTEGQGDVTVAIIGDLSALDIN